MPRVKTAPSALPPISPDTPPLAIYRRLLRQTLPYWKVFAVSVMAMVLYAATETGFAALMKPLIDGGFVNKDPEAIRLLPLMILGLFLVGGLASFTSTYGMGYVGRSVVSDLRRQLFHRLLHLPVAYFDSASSGQIIARLTYEVDQVLQATTTAVTVLVRDSVAVLGLLAWLFYLQWQLALISLLVGPFLALLVLYVNRRFRHISRKIQSSMGNLTHAVEEAVKGSRVIKIFGGEQRTQQHFEQVDRAHRQQALKMAAMSGGSAPITQLIAAAALAGIVYLATLPSMLATITVGTFISFIIAMMMLFAPLKRLTTINATIQRGIVAAHGVFTFLEQPLEANNGTLRLERARGAVEFHNVTFAYQPRKGRVLENVNLRIEPGQTVALVGRSGGGKSTLVSLLARFYDPVMGHVTLDGHDLRALDLGSLRDQMALVSQDIVLFNDTIANNIAFGCRHAVSLALIEQAAEAAYAMEFIRTLPQGMDTVVGERGLLLSGGQRQRVAIARALLKDAPVLILDEATAALDNESERYIQAALTRLVRNRTTFIIAHRLSTIEQADVIVVLHHGRIVEQGRHAELLARGGHYAALHRMQFHPPQEVAAPG